MILISFRLTLSTLWKLLQDAFSVCQLPDTSTNRAVSNSQPARHPPYLLYINDNFVPPLTLTSDAQHVINKTKTHTPKNLGIATASRVTISGTTAGNDRRSHANAAGCMTVSAAGSRVTPRHLDCRVGVKRWPGGRGEFYYYLLLLDDREGERFG
jgi:hypothetical protein